MGFTSKLEQGCSGLCHAEFWKSPGREILPFFQATCSKAKLLSRWKNFHDVNETSLIMACDYWLLSFTLQPLRKTCLHHCYNSRKGLKTAVRSLLDISISRLNKTSSFNFSQLTAPSPPYLLLLWTCSVPYTSTLYWRNWTHIPDVSLLGPSRSEWPLSLVALLLTY